MNPREDRTKRTGVTALHQIEISIQIGQKNLSVRKKGLTEKNRIFHPQIVISPIENLSLTNPKADLTKSLIKKIPAKKDRIKKTSQPTPLLLRH